MAENLASSTARRGLAAGRRRRAQRPIVVACVHPQVARAIAAHAQRSRAWELLSCRADELGFVTANLLPLGLVGGIFQFDGPQQPPPLPAGVPVVLIDQPPQDGLLGVAADGLAIGALAFRSLRARGFRRFGFWGVPGYWTSDQRQLGFAGAVAGAGCQLHPGARPPLGSFAEIMAAGIAWLRSAPKPIAVVTDSNRRGVEMLWAARLAGLAVPEQVAVLAGSEDPVHCMLCAPGLSAVDDDAAGLGFAAGALFDEAASGGRPLRRWRWIAPRQVIERASTRTLAEVPPAVATGLAHIHAQATSGIGVAAVVHAAGVPRRTLELAFRTSLDRSISEEIALTRVGRIRELLETSRLGLVEIAMRVGLHGDASLLNRLFTRHAGLGPADYRRRHGLRGRRVGRAAEREHDALRPPAGPRSGHS